MTEIRCTTTHHTGCACHEAKRDAEIERLTRERDEARADDKHAREMNAHYIDQVCALRAENERLRADRMGLRSEIQRIASASDCGPEARRIAVGALEWSNPALAAVDGERR